MIKKHIIIAGKVQGVGFRKYTVKRAIENEIIGWVRNLSTGEVEVYCEARNEISLESFLKFIRRGPERSLVQMFEMKDVAESSFKGHTFTMEPDGETLCQKF